MGRFSRNTYRLLKQPDASGVVRDYRGVRLQMGVPLVDADWNEMEDTRKHELRSLIEQVIGSGAPDDGFAIHDIEMEVEDGPITLKIKGGRFVAHGVLVHNPTTIAYTEQQYYAGNPAGLALAQARGITPVAVLPPPTSGVKNTFYLEVWEREVTSSEDPRLMDNVLLEETSTRLMLEWVVRAAWNGATMPASDETYTRVPLAEFTYGAWDGGMYSEFNDLRRKGLSLSRLVGADKVMQLHPTSHLVYGFDTYFGAAVLPQSDYGNTGEIMIPLSLPNGARLLNLRVRGKKIGGTLRIEFRAHPVSNPYDWHPYVLYQNWYDWDNYELLDITLAVPYYYHRIVDNDQFRYYLKVTGTVRAHNAYPNDAVEIYGLEIGYRH